MTVREEVTEDMHLLSSDDVASDVIMSDDAIRTDDLCEEKDQSETETEGSSSSDANRFEKVFVTCVI